MRRIKHPDRTSLFYDAHVVLEWNSPTRHRVMKSLNTRADRLPGVATRWTSPTRMGQVTHQTGLNRVAWDGHVEWWRYKKRSGSYVSAVYPDLVGIRKTFRANIEFGDQVSW
jgi:hypothetical protein